MTAYSSFCSTCGADVPAGFAQCGPCSLEADSALALIQARRKRSALSEESIRVTVAGLAAVNVQVEPINADVECEGLTRVVLLSDVKSTLESHGMGIFGQSDVFLDPGIPILHLDVMTVLLDATCVYSIRLELWQAVKLVRNPCIQTLAVTWTAPGLIGTVRTDHITDIRSAVRAAVQQFVADAVPPAAREPWRA